MLTLLFFKISLNQSSADGVRARFITTEEARPFFLSKINLGAEKGKKYSFH
jgi:hypothetical protein